MITNKIEALKAAKKLLECKSNYYLHDNTSECNCGFVVRAIGVKKDEIVDDIGLDCGYYSDAVSKENLKICSTSGLPVSAVIRAMFEAGFSEKDISNLEGLLDGDICERAGMDGSIHNYFDVNLRGGCNNRENVIAYITAWIEILEEQEGITKEVEPKVVYVTIDAKVKALISERQLSHETTLN